MAQSVEVAIPWRQNVPNLAASFAETRTPLEDDDASIIFLPQLNSFVDPALAQDVQNGNKYVERFPCYDRRLALLPQHYMGGGADRMCEAVRRHGYVPRQTANASAAEGAED